MMSELSKAVLVVLLILAIIKLNFDIEKNTFAYLQQFWIFATAASDQELADLENVSSVNIFSGICS
jgi:hypothetical protein